MSKIAFIVEGKKTEKVVIKSFMDNFMNSNNFDELDIEEIVLPMETNIYTLYKKMKEYDFFEDLDIINIIEEVFKSKGKSFEGYKKDTFGEIYLFFDYDRHANDVDNHDDIIDEMLDIFDNETENGKLFISYPMIEAVKDFSDEICKESDECRIRIEDFSKYKNLVSKRAAKTDFRKYDKDTWKFIINNFIVKTSCLFDKRYDYNYDFYINNVFPRSIYDKQMDKFFKVDSSVMILSAIPEFIIDYLGRRVFEDNFRYKYCDNYIK